MIVRHWHMPTSALRWGKEAILAMDVAKMTLISSDLGKISDAIRLSVFTTRTIRENLFWAFIYNLIGVPIAAGILYPINGFSAQSHAGWGGNGYE